MRHLSKKSPDAAQSRFAQATAPEGAQHQAGRLRLPSSQAWPGRLWPPQWRSPSGGWSRGQATPAMIWAMTGLFLAAGAIRIGANHWAAVRLDQAADRILARERTALLTSQDRPRAAG
jgi:hypothetical protein